MLTVLVPVFTGETKATPAEFDAIAKVLDIKAEVSYLSLSALSSPLTWST